MGWFSVNLHLNCRSVSGRDGVKRLNPTTRVEKDLNKLLLNIKVNNTGTTPQIGPNLYKKLHCNNSTPASFYGLPKIHKPERPLRPITSSIGSPTYAVSKHLVSILAPLRKNSYTVKNSSEFVHELKQYSIADDEIMVSFDVKSLFTSIPVEEKEKREEAQKIKSGASREQLPVWLYQGMRKSAGNKTISAYHEWLCSTSVC